jgi:hypothetical protein
MAPGASQFLGIAEMTNLESLRSLQKRIREATGPDRELDLAIYQDLDVFNPALKGFPARGAFSPDAMEVPKITLDPDGLGPCVALQRAVLPGCEWSKDRRGEIIIFDELPAKVWAVVAIAKPLANDCLTFLDAIFSAAIDQEEAKEKADVV